MRQVYCLFLFTLLCAMGCNSSSNLFNQGNYQSQLGEIDTNLTYRTYLGLQIVQVKLGGESYDFLFDTGAPMVVSPGLRKRLNMKVLTRKRVHDSQGKTNYLNYVRMAPLELGGLVFKNFTAIEADLRANAALACLDVDGIVGANLMRLFYWEMNPSERVLRMTNNWKLLEPTEAMNPVSFRAKSTGTPVLDKLEINGLTLSNITFDTGSGGSLKLSEKDGVLVSDSNGVVTVGYHSFGLFGGKVDTQSSSLVKLKIGSDSLAYFPLNMDKKKSSKLLGMAFFENYRTLINWQQKKAYFEPVKKYSGLNDSVYAVLPVYADSTLQVGRILIRPKGPVLNLSLGDTILMVNDIKTYPAEPSTYCRVIAELNKVKKTRLSVKNKGEFTLVKQPKFSALPPRHAKMDD